MRKTIYLGSPLGYFLYIAALSFLATALGTVAFAWKGKASTEKK